MTLVSSHEQGVVNQHEASSTLNGMSSRVNDLAQFENISSDGSLSIDFMVANLNCAGCMAKIERHFSKDPSIQKVRVNLTQRQVHFEWLEGSNSGGRIRDDLDNLGFQASPFLDADQTAKTEQKELRHLLWCLGIAGFAAANVMLLSVSIWSGATGATRDLFHWLSALIALPAVAYAGQPFYSSALRALRAHQLNMDVPISLAVILASAISLFETVRHGEHAFFDAALTLLFFLLIGRTLDRLMRERAFSGVRQLLAFKSKSAQIIDEHGTQRTIAIGDIEPGMIVFILPGETIPVDGRIVDGFSDIDWSLVNGEAVPRRGAPGDEVYSGLLNLSGPLQIKTEAVGEETLLAEIVRLMSQANERAPKYRKIADRAAAFYAPLVHLAALFTFAGWMFYGASWQVALYTAISVLIITCPCALGLAVPVVQVVASSIAHKHGILMKDGSALEKLGEIDTVVFDKTGTLTLSKPILTGQYFDAELLFPLAASLSKNSLHPLSRALSSAGLEAVGLMPISMEPDFQLSPITDIEEHPGFGLRGKWQGGELRIGSFEWCEVDSSHANDDGTDLMLWASYKSPNGKVSNALFTFEDQLRPGVSQVISSFKKMNIDVQLLSGDRKSAVERLAQCLDIKIHKAEMKPAEKCSYIEELGQMGRKVLMVGDGINDGPSLKAAYISLSPSSASDVAQVTAGFILMGESLLPLTGLYKLARSSKKLINQNFGMAALYNLIAVPIAIMGMATPIVAAIAMSLSSMIVTANALRLHYLANSYGWQVDGPLRKDNE